MLQYDYLTEVIAQFVEAVSRHLRKSRELEQEIPEAIALDEAIAGLLDLDPAVALRLDAASLVQMMVLSGMGDGVAEYVAYALRGAADAYARGGDELASRQRIEQAEAVEQSFGIEPESVPEGFESA